MRFAIPERLSALGVTLQTLLTGEPLRAINYGAIAVVYLTVKVLVATGNMSDPPDFDGIAVAVTAAIAAITEVARRFTFSPNTVDVLVEDALIFGVDGRDTT